MPFLSYKPRNPKAASLAGSGQNESLAQTIRSEMRSKHVCETLNILPAWDDITNSHLRMRFLPKASNTGLILLHAVVYTSNLLMMPCFKPLMPSECSGSLSAILFSTVAYQTCYSTAKLIDLSTHHLSLRLCSHRIASLKIKCIGDSLAIIAVLVPHTVAWSYGYRST